MRSAIDDRVKWPLLFQSASLQKASRFWGTLILSSALLCFSVSADAKKKRSKNFPTKASDCGSAKKGQLAKHFAMQGQPLWAGPGDGFSAVKLQEKNACLPKYEAIGDFVLVEYEKNKVAWLRNSKNTVEPNNGSGRAPDAKLGKQPKDAPDAAQGNPLENEALQDAGDKVVFDVPKEQFVLRSSVLFSEARVESVAISILAKDTPVQVLAEAKDGRWVQVVFEKQEGWLNAFHLANKVFEKGSEVAVEKDSDWIQNQTAFKRIKKERAKKEESTANDPLMNPADDDNAQVNGKLGDGVKLGSINRQMELTVEIGGAGFLQDYRSDSQNDPFHAYLLQSLGPSFHLDFALRSSGSFVFTSSLDLGLSTIGFAPIAGLIEAETTVFFLPMQAEVGAGWRILENDAVDVEIGLGLRTEFLPYFGFEETPAKLGMQNALPSTLHVGVVPRVRALSRLGVLGLLSIEGSFDLGASFFFPEPGDTYLAPPGGARPPIPIIPGEEQDVPPVGQLFHLGVSAAGTVRYIYPISDGFMLTLSSSMRVLQTTTSGAGTRLGTYTQATQVDVRTTTQVGVVIGF